MSTRQRSRGLWGKNVFEQFVLAVAGMPRRPTLETILAICAKYGLLQQAPSSASMRRLVRNLLMAEAAKLAQVRVWRGASGGRLQACIAGGCMINALRV